MANTVTGNAVTGEQYAAEVIKPAGAADTGALRVAGRCKQIVDVSSVGAGAFDSGIIDCGAFRTQRWIFTNGDSVSRQLQVYTVLDDGTLVTDDLITVTTGVIEYVVTGGEYVGKAAGSGGTQALGIARRRQFKSPAAAGTAPVRLVGFGF